MLAHALGDRTAASEHARKGLASARAFVRSASVPQARAHAQSAAVTAHVMLGRLAEEAGDWARASAHYTDATGEPGFETDAYASIASINLAFRDVYTSVDAGREGILRACFDRYKAVLKSSPQCLFAGVGLGMVEAEQGRLESARDMFTSLREASQDALPVAVDLAHLETATGQHVAGGQLYGFVAKRIGDVYGRATGHAIVEGGFGSSPADHASTLLFQARACVEGKDFEAGLPLLARAVAYAPADARLRYNLAWLQSRVGYELVPPETPPAGAPAPDTSSFTEASMARGLSLMQQALGAFAWLRGMVDDKAAK
jgi:tetratricopeptide (TPR) repeat protein